MDQIQAVLDNYQLADGWKALLERLDFAVLVVPTSAGRTSIINELVKAGAYSYVVSDTTRQPREVNGVLEQDGIEYFFRSQDEVLADIKSGLYLGLAVVSNEHLSGLSMRELEKAADSETTAITELNLAGAKQVKAQKPDTSVIYIVPPPFEEWMKRLNKIGEMTTEDIQLHLEQTEKELQAALEIDFINFVVNDNLADTTARVRKIVEGQVDSIEPEAAHDAAWRFLSQVKQQLYS